MLKTSAILGQSLIKTSSFVSIEAAKSYQKALEINEIEAELDSEEIRTRLFSIFEV